MIEIPKSDDGEWVRVLAQTMRAHPDGAGIDHKACAERLEGIALACDERDVLKQKEVRAHQLEKRIDEALSRELETWFESVPPDQEERTLRYLVAAVWLTGRQIKSAGVVQGIASLAPLLALGDASLGKSAGHKDLEDLEKRYGKPKHGEKRRR